MTILTIRTDRAEAEVGLYKDVKKVGYKEWLADRRLTGTIHTSIQELLNKSSFDWDDIEGIVVFEGPGSFTGLRIGLSTANALASANQIPIVGSSGQKWLETGIRKLIAGESDKIVMPRYGSPPNITKPKK